jgi:hypothetical protein
MCYCIILSYDCSHERTKRVPCTSSPSILRSFSRACFTTTRKVYVEEDCDFCQDRDERNEYYERRRLRIMESRRKRNAINSAFQQRSFRLMRTHRAGGESAPGVAVTSIRRVRSVCESHDSKLATIPLAPSMNIKEEKATKNISSQHKQTAFPVSGECVHVEVARAGTPDAEISSQASSSDWANDVPAKYSSPECQVSQNEARLPVSEDVASEEGSTRALNGKDGSASKNGMHSPELGIPIIKICPATPRPSANESFPQDPLLLTLSTKIPSPRNVFQSIQPLQNTFYPGWRAEYPIAPATHSQRITRKTSCCDELFLGQLTSELHSEASESFWRPWMTGSLHHGDETRPNHASAADPRVIDKGCSSRANMRPSSTSDGKARIESDHLCRSLTDKIVNICTNQVQAQPEKLKTPDLRKCKDDRKLLPSQVRAMNTPSPVNFSLPRSTKPENLPSRPLIKRDDSRTPTLRRRAASGRLANLSEERNVVAIRV